MNAQAKMGFMAGYTSKGLDKEAIRGDQFLTALATRVPNEAIATSDRLTDLWKNYSSMANQTSPVGRQAIRKYALPKGNAGLPEITRLLRELKKSPGIDTAEVVRENTRGAQLILKQVFKNIMK